MKLWFELYVIYKHTHTSGSFLENLSTLNACGKEPVQTKKKADAREGQTFCSMIGGKELEGWMIVHLSVGEKNV